MVRWWMWLFFSYGCLTIIFGILDGVSTDPDQVALLSRLSQFNVLTTVEFFSVTIPMPNASFFTDMARLFLWDFPHVFYGDWMVFRWLVLGCVGFGASIVFVTDIGPVLLNALFGLRNLIPFLR